MQKSYAATQVCQLTLSRHEIEKVLLDNLIKLGGDPSYDFATDHPIFIWNADGGISVRFVQAAVVAKEPDRWFSLKPVKTEREIQAEMEKRITSAKA